MKDKNIDIRAELASIEETRAAFELAVKENRFQDLMNYGTKDAMSLTPDCGTWEAFVALQGQPSGEFHYDSLVMKPMETIVVSDSVAYDFGTSTTYYTNADGKSIGLPATYLTILKKDKNDGVWKLHREVANTRNIQ
ncbi:hypothetical protein PP182_07710 [Maribacter sp. PR1]|uniref:DUF4440 domain-containing protein n=1 Tax=Maribacter cobaltidurans TaxID=1178778 RepID=A0ABU7ISK0_9FLAO|nr:MULTISPECIES: hypothetical protein [Maribacter]MDC6388564.1 hypothetical protein [Maribacter sp. PR1]MEE1975953.1 hypothetical protein [Maribacter cobaltidurans]